MMKRKWPVYILVMVSAAVLLFSCATPARESRMTYEEQVKRVPAKNFENYSFAPGDPLYQRLQEPPAFVLGHIREMDGNPAYSAYLPDETERYIIEFALENLPPKFSAILKDRLLGIYFINDFLGSGMADYVLDDENNLYFTLTFNPKVLSMSMTELVSYRENSCFIQDDPSLSIEIELSDEAPGFFYILMHEAAHVVDYLELHTPYVEPGMKEIFHYTAESTPYTENVWKEYAELTEDHPFSYSGRLTFYGMYGGPSVPLSEAMEVYREFENLPCASLYGTKTWAEDFAEMATFSYLVDVMNMEYRIVLRQEGREIYSYEPFSSAEVQERAALVRPLLY